MVQTKSYADANTKADADVVHTINNMSANSFVEGT